MDLGFIWGPKILQAVLHDGKTPKETIIKSHDRFTSYLLVINAARWYIWVFLLKSKDPPIALIYQFLNKHGTATKGSITTAPGGLLHKSKTFQTLCINKGYANNTSNIIPHLDFKSAGIEQLHHTICTDNGGELAGSANFCQVSGQHGYILETTAPDATNQNGLVKRPHPTLKERVRCLLYTAGLSIPFWSCALLHTVWLYNRTFHLGLDITPYQAYTKERPTLDGLLTFGSRITPKKSTQCGTALDPNAHHGIFLGYRATTDNILYWDTHAHWIRMAKHTAQDKLQYGEAPDAQSPASKHLLETITGALHAERRTDILLKTCKPELEMIKETLLQINEQLIADSPLPATAAAAKFARPNPSELMQQFKMLDVTLNIFEPAVTETLQLHGTHETLELVTEQHPEYLETVVIRQCHPRMVLHKTSCRWKSQLKGSIIRVVDDTSITDTDQLCHVLNEKQRKGQTQVRIQFAQPQWNSMTGEGLPTLHFNQLNVIAHHLHHISTGEDLWIDRNNWPPIDNASITLAVMKGLAIPKKLDAEPWSPPAISWPKFRTLE
jgi:hypothetical protein